MLFISSGFAIIIIIIFFGERESLCGEEERKRKRKTLKRAACPAWNTMKGFIS